MADVGKPARSGMMIFVLVIFVVAILLALGYLLFAHPGEAPSNAPAVQSVPTQ
ncbi:hypothetical protein [Rhizobium leguminosarum]|uniref:hypothetical protein n=1 Tax=Rhizobium leguminosarum TaxID=384 RepID=UPI001C983608|nr:hypothetical protein [Rhizobium leguminosarum]MBY5346604.1 hypothetical protein [Rhizobium leguminosarum]